MWRASLLSGLAACVGILAGCATTEPPADKSGPVSASLLAQDEAMTRPLGRAPGYRPAPLGNRLAAAGAPVGRWRCVQARPADYGAHIELFANEHEVLVPAGIGIAPPQQRRGAFVLSGRCQYALYTIDPTGVVHVMRVPPGPTPRLGELFRLWGQSLGRGHLAGFRGSVRAFVGGQRWTRDPRDIPLTRHTQIVLALGSSVHPHPFYLFPKGL
jgi:hypothetical protein